MLGPGRGGLQHQHCSRIVDPLTSSSSNGLLSSWLGLIRPLGQLVLMTCLLLSRRQGWGERVWVVFVCFLGGGGTFGRICICIRAFSRSVRQCGG